MRPIPLVWFDTLTPVLVWFATLELPHWARPKDLTVTPGWTVHAYGTIAWRRPKYHGNGTVCGAEAANVFFTKDLLAVNCVRCLAGLRREAKEAS